MIQPETFQFTEPEFCLGQKVKTQSALVGHISGLVFYPDSKSWCYGLHISSPEDDGIHEIWYAAEELEVYVAEPVNKRV